MKSILIHDKGSNILYEATVYQVVTLFTEATRREAPTHGPRALNNDCASARSQIVNQPYRFTIWLELFRTFGASDSTTEAFPGT